MITLTNVDYNFQNANTCCLVDFGWRPEGFDPLGKVKAKDATIFWWGYHERNLTDQVFESKVRNSKAVILLIRNTDESVKTKLPALFARLNELGAYIIVIAVEESLSEKGKQENRVVDSVAVLKDTSDLILVCSGEEAEQRTIDFVNLVSQGNRWEKGLTTDFCKQGIISFGIGTAAGEKCCEAALEQAKNHLTSRQPLSAVRRAYVSVVGSAGVAACHTLPEILTQMFGDDANIKLGFHESRTNREEVTVTIIAA